jgi:hypothetical protein
LEHDLAALTQAHKLAHARTSTVAFPRETSPRLTRLDFARCQPNERHVTATLSSFEAEQTAEALPASNMFIRLVIALLQN